MRDLSLKISLKYKVCIGIIAFCVMMILQLATSFGFLGEGFSYYISSVYTKLTAGGVFFGVLAYGLQAAVTQVFAYILLSTGVIICVLIMLDVFHRLGGKKERKEPARKSRKDFRSKRAILRRELGRRFHIDEDFVGFSEHQRLLLLKKP